MMTQLEWRYPWLADRSTWRGQQGEAEEEEGELTLHRAEHGCWVLGNGQTFAARYGETPTRLEALLGPTYARDEGFVGWGSQAVTLHRQGGEVTWRGSELFRVRRSAIVGVDLDGGDVRVLVVDLAPPDWPLILRTIVVQNVGEETLAGLTLTVTHDGLPEADLLARPNGWEAIRPERRLRVALDGPAAEIAPERMVLSIPELLPGEDVTHHVALITGTEEVGVALLEEKLWRDPDGLAGITYHWWQQWMAGTLSVTAEDPRLGDLIDDAKVLVAVQQSPCGVIAPLVVRSTARVSDQFAPLRFLLENGKLDEARLTLEARYGALCRQGAFPAQLSVDLLPVEEQVSEPEWDQLTPPPAWAAALIVRSYWYYLRQGGDPDVIARHLNYIRWLIMAQPLSEDGLAAFSGEEPFYLPFQRSLPDALGRQLLPDPGPVGAVEPLPWGAAPSMALAAAARMTAALAAGAGRDDDARALGDRAARISEGIETALWCPDPGYYAAARSRVDGRLYTAPHLMTALAPLLTGYASGEDPRARRALQEMLSYLVSQSGVPLMGPGVDAFTGNELGGLLAALAVMDDPRADTAYRALLACAMPSGAFRERYGPPASTQPPDVAHPAHTAAAVLGLVEYLATFMLAADGVTVTPHMPPGNDHLHLTELRESAHRVEMTVRKLEYGELVQVGNAGPGDLCVRLREDTFRETAYLLHPGGRHAWRMPLAAAGPQQLPPPRAYVPGSLQLPPAPVLVLTTDATSFADWQAAGAVLLDATFPLTPTALGEVLMQGDTRRYDVLYVDVPMAGEWAVLPETFWAQPGLQRALGHFSEMGGVVLGTAFVDTWTLEQADRPTAHLHAAGGYLRLPLTQATACAVIPGRPGGATTEVLLWAWGGPVELWLNGDCLWASDQPGGRYTIPARLRPGDNAVALRGHGATVILGVRPPLRWAQWQQERAA